MKELTITIPVKSFKKFDNPYDSKAMAAKYQFFVNVADIPSEWLEWLSVNPREQKLTTDVARDIAKSLRSSKKNFHVLNRGILLSAEEVTFDNKEKMATIKFLNPNMHGIVDGGHTYRQILKYQEEINPIYEKYVQVEVITSFDSIEELAEARNNSVAVDDKSIEELRGTFDPIKRIIENQRIQGEKYFDRISFRQNEFWGNKDVNNIIDVREIISIINMFNPILYDPMTPTHPIQSYTGKAASLNKFLKMSPPGVKEEDPEYRKAVIEKLTKIIPDIFKLWDDIEVNFAKVSKELNRRYGSKPYSNYGKDNVKKISMFSNVEMDYTLPKGIMYPVVGAFRALVCERDGQYDWTISPFNVWDEKKEQIVTSVLESSAQFGNSPDKLGKSTLLWDSLYNMILIYRITNEMKNK